MVAHAKMLARSAIVVSAQQVLYHQDVQRHPELVHRTHVEMVVHAFQWVSIYTVAHVHRKKRAATVNWMFAPVAVC